MFLNEFRTISKTVLAKSVWGGGRPPLPAPLNTDDKPSVLIQTVTIIAVTGVRYIILNRPDISAVECCNRSCVFPCVKFEQG